MPKDVLNKLQITEALRRLGDLAKDEGIVLELSLYGGAVFTAVYGSRDSTKDVDAIVHPSAVTEKLAKVVAHEQGLVDNWLRDQVKHFLAEKEAKRKLEGNEFGPGLQVSVPTAAYLLAMKLRAARAPLAGYSGDTEDIQFLLQKMEISTLAEAEKIFDRFFPQDSLSEFAREFVQKTISDRKKP
jgi:hypothetical protein